MTRASHVRDREIGRQGDRTDRETGGQGDDLRAYHGMQSLISFLRVLTSVSIQSLLSALYPLTSFSALCSLPSAQAEVRMNFERHMPGMASNGGRCIDGGGRGPFIGFLPGYVRYSMPKLNASLPPTAPASTTSSDTRTSSDSSSDSSSDTPTPTGGDIAILRIDVDMYEGYLDVFFHMAHRVPVGGFFLMDDYLCVPEAKNAVDDFRSWHGITSRT